VTAIIFYENYQSFKYRETHWIIYYRIYDKNSTTLYEKNSFVEVIKNLDKDSFENNYVECLNTDDNAK